MGADIGTAPLPRPAEKTSGGDRLAQAPPLLHQAVPVFTAANSPSFTW